MSAPDAGMLAASAGGTLGTDVLAQAVGVAAKSIADNANALGLTWQLRLGTIITGSETTQLTVRLDGDTEAIGMISMIGPVPANYRAYVITAPPSGNFIVGLVDQPYRARQTLSAAASQVTFGDIPTNLRSLRLKWRARGDAAVNLQFIGFRYNALATAVYFWNYTQGINATASAASLTLQTFGMIGFCTGASAGAGVYASGVTDFIDWNETDNAVWNHNSQALGTGVANFANTVGGGLFGATSVGPWRLLTIFPNSGNFVADSDFQLVGEP